MAIRVYLASPFFTDEQQEREERLRSALRGLGYEVFAPKESGVLEPSDGLSRQSEIFSQNVAELQLCDMCFVVTDGKDVGTIWEAGYACALRDQRLQAGIPLSIPKIVYYCETLGGNPFNVMLARSADAVLTRFEELAKLPGILARGGNVYAGKIQ